MADDIDEMDEAAKAVGELILWANMIDDQLNKVLVGAFALPKHPFVLPIVAQLDVRPKAEMLKGRMKLLPETNEWRVKVTEWVKQVEKVNDNRNIVAHHRIEIVSGKVRLATSQINKLIKSIDSTMKPKPDKGLADMKKWVKEAAETYDRGRVIIDNAERFRENALGKLRDAGTAD